MSLGLITQNGLLCLIFELGDLASQWVLLEVGPRKFWKLFDVGFFGLLEKLSFDFTLVANLQLLLVDTAFVGMSLGHVASELLRFVELLKTNLALVHRNFWLSNYVCQLFEQFGSPFVFGDGFVGSLYLQLISKRFKNV